MFCKYSYVEPGTILNCNNYGTISSSYGADGIVTVCDGKIKKCSNHGVLKCIGDEEDGCSMVVSTELTLLRELTLMEIAMAAMEYMIIHPKREWEKRERGAYAEKERSKAIGETKIAIARGKHPEVKGEYGTVIGLIVEDEKGKPVAAGVRNVDGIQAKAHQIYSMTEEREWVEVQK